MKLKQKIAPSLAAAYICLFVIMFALTSLTPMIADDYSYCFSWMDDSRIKSVGQIIDSMAVHRQVTNGRVLLHGMVQFILIFPKFVFNFLNALNAVFLAFLFSRCLSRKNDRQTALLLVFGAILLWNFTPAFGQVFLWLDGAMNYAWIVTLCLFFLYPFVRLFLDEGKKWGKLGFLAFIPLSFVFGASAEGFVPATLAAAGLLTLMIWKRDRKLPVQFLVWMAFALLGYLFLMTAPSIATRTGGFDPSVMAGTLKKIIARTKEELMVLYMIYAGLLVLSAKADKKKLILSAVFVVAGLVSLAMYVFAAYFAERHFLFTVVFTVLAILILLDELLNLGKRDVPAMLAAVMTVLFCFNFAQGAMDITVVYSHYRQREQAVTQAKAEGINDLALQVYVASTKYSAPYMLDDLTEDPRGWPNTSVAMYYGLDSVIGYMPEE